ncbi:MAG: PA2169 family four-helix-bundle protein [Psychroserpens sp.]|uniref:ferritin-like domain-containing protein n=1 Tax=Psychroserpens sp. TaxID=2020870 RepID=UPI003C783EAF
MNNNFNEVERKLNELLEKAYDAEKGFKKAAENTDNQRIKKFFHDQARERSGYINELVDALKRRGMNVEENDGSISGTLHRAWIDTKALFSFDNDESMLEEVRNGEKAALKDYNDILEDPKIDLEIRDILLKQKAAIQNSYDKADYLEDLY